MDFSPLKSFLDELITVQHIPGVDCAVLKDGKEIFHTIGDGNLLNTIAPFLYFFISPSSIWIRLIFSVCNIIICKHNHSSI